jgi:hypothetical protein
VSKALFDEQVSKFPPRLLELRRWTVHACDFPRLELLFDGDGRQPIRLRFLFDDWDATPPSVEMLSKGGGALATIPRAPDGRIQQFHPGGRGARPFICMAGIREYHNNPQHKVDAWDNYRGTSDFDLGGILTKIWSAWTKLTP